MISAPSRISRPVVVPPVSASIASRRMIGGTSDRNAATVSSESPKAYRFQFSPT